MKILIVEDDTDMGEVLSSSLYAEGFAVDVAMEGRHAVSLQQINEYDLVILDLHLPDMGGEEVCRAMREGTKAPPILMLTVTPDVETKVRLLNAGADDYLVKPFSFDELLARARALLRRSTQMTPDVLSVQDLTLDAQQHAVSRKGKNISLTRKEFALLEYLLRKQGAVVSKETLIEHVWQSSSNPFSDSIDTHMTNLRKKLGTPKIIHTVAGRGYRIG